MTNTNGLAPELAAALAQMQIAISKSETKEGLTAAPAASPPTPAKVVQLPFWPEPARGTPNSFLRSALFAAIQGKGRRQMKREILASVSGVVVRFTGLQLDQSDFEVWEQAIHFARQHPLGNTCHFTGYSFLRALGHTTGANDYKWLDDAIDRLIACAVIIETKEKTFTGSLLSSCVRDKATRRYKLTLDPDTMKLYGWNDWTAVDWDQRAELRGKPLALWLHGFYSSHAKPHPIKIDTLKMLSGSGTKERWKFKQNLTRAFADLEAVTGIKATIESELVTVERTGTRSQQRHVTRRQGQRAWVRKARKQEASRFS